MKKYLLITLILFLNIVVFAQDDITFNPVKHNPSFAGSKGTSRLIYSPVLPGVLQFYNSNFETSFSYDTYAKKIKSGIAIQVGHLFDFSDFRTTALGAAVSIAPKFNITKDLMFSPSYRFHFEKEGLYNDSYGFKHDLGFLINNKTTLFGYVLSIPQYYHSDEVYKSTSHLFHFSKSFKLNQKLTYTPIVTYTFWDVKSPYDLHRSSITLSNFISNNRIRVATYSEIKFQQMQGNNRIDYVNGLIFGMKHQQLKVQVGVFAHSKLSSIDLSGKLSVQYVFKKKKD